MQPEHDIYNSIRITQIQRGMVFWECEGGHDACFVATADWCRADKGVAVFGREIPGGGLQRFYENDRAGGYGPRLYWAPQYTNLGIGDWLALHQALAHVIQADADEAMNQAAARESGLSLAATQYSESRDRWMQEAKDAQAEIARLRGVIESLCDIATQHLNGITMGQQIIAAARAALAQTEAADA